MDKQTRQIIAFHIGDRSQDSARQLWAKMVPERIMVTLQKDSFESRLKGGWRSREVIGQDVLDFSFAVEHRLFGRARSQTYHIRLYQTLSGTGVISPGSLG